MAMKRLRAEVSGTRWVSCNGERCHYPLHTAIASLSGSVHIESSSQGPLGTCLENGPCWFPDRYTTLSIFSTSGHLFFYFILT